MQLRKFFYFRLFLTIQFFMLFSSSLANDKAFEIAGKAGYKFVFDKENKQGELRGEKFQYGGSVLYILNPKIKAGIIFDYWDDYYDLNGTFQGGVFTKLRIYKTGALCKYQLLKFGNKLQLNLGGSFDYYVSTLTYHYPNSSFQGYVRDKASYKNIGIGFLTEVRYNYVSFWTETSIVRLTGGKIEKSNSVWESRGAPNFNFHNITSGIGLSFEL